MLGISSYCGPELFLCIYCVWVRVALVILYTEPDNLHARHLVR